MTPRPARLPRASAPPGERAPSRPCRKARPRVPALLRAAFAPAAALLATGGCATLLGSTRPTLRIQTDSVVATVLDSAGRTLGTTPFLAALPTRRRQSLRLAAPGYDTATVSVGRRPRTERFLNLVNPVGWLVDVSTGAVYDHDPSTLRVALVRHEALSEAVMAVVLSEFADAAAAAGCEPLLVDAWRDAALLLGRGNGAVPDSVRRLAREEVARVGAEVREACARPSARMARLREIRESLGTAPEPDPAALLFAPVYFEVGEWRITEDSVRERLRALGRHLAAAGEGVTLRVEGFADPSGPATIHRETGFARAGAVIAELRRGGAPHDCCVAVSHGADPSRQVAPGAAGAAPEARWNRRVTFALDYRSTP